MMGVIVAVVGRVKTLEFSFFFRVWDGEIMYGKLAKLLYLTRDLGRHSL